MITNMDSKTEKVMHALFNTSYYVAIENVAFSKFRSLCQLQIKTSLDLDNLYKKIDGCKEFISAISKLKNSAKHSAVIEQENIFARFVDGGKLCTEFVDIIPISNANAERS